MASAKGLRRKRPWPVSYYYLDITWNNQGKNEEHDSRQPVLLSELELGVPVKQLFF
jgi:hypothetical protein